MEAREVKKLYYSIGEVSQITGLKQYVLRYWETEFPHIKPSKNRAGNRIYKTNDLDNIKELKNLLHNKKFTIKGAKQFLKDKNLSPNSSIDADPKVLKLIDTLDVKTLKNIQKSLDDLLAILDKKNKV
ncbi:MAG: MerR family transcriptional regulator [Pelagibacteraceae bacterium TMED124]|nr:transcriptional regulator [Candidatus Neomarinimicrobiota bacterium]RPG17351.1 MAG: MerR family transcriptional regulator [Pelagibacteraceae bacterium TMED124]